MKPTYKIIDHEYATMPKEEDEQKALIQHLRFKGFFAYATTNDNTHSFTNRKYAMIIEKKAKIKQPDRAKNWFFNNYSLAYT